VRTPSVSDQVNLTTRTLFRPALPHFFIILSSLFFFLLFPFLFSNFTGVSKTHFRVTEPAKVIITGTTLPLVLIDQSKTFAVWLRASLRSLAVAPDVVIDRVLPQIFL